MNYHMIRTDDMLNGEGLRVVVFLSGCEHHCFNCHNPETWNCNSGKIFGEEEVDKICQELENDYISGVTLSGGDPLYPSNLPDVYNLLTLIKTKFPNKNIWLYTGYTLESIIDNVNENSTCRKRNDVINLCDVIVDGEFDDSLADVNYPWAGSTNQNFWDNVNGMWKKRNYSNNK